MRIRIGRPSVHGVQERSTAKSGLYSNLSLSFQGLPYLRYLTEITRASLRCGLYRDRKGKGPTLFERLPHSAVLVIFSDLDVWLKISICRKQTNFSHESHRPLRAVQLVISHKRRVKSLINQSLALARSRRTNSILSLLPNPLLQIATRKGMRGRPAAPRPAPAEPRARRKREFPET